VSVAVVLSHRVRMLASERLSCLTSKEVGAGCCTLVYEQGIDVRRETLSLLLQLLLRCFVQCQLFLIFVSLFYFVIHGFESKHILLATIANVYNYSRITLPIFWFVFLCKAPENTGCTSYLLYFLFFSV
jgi:hypothetical protein